MANIPIETRKAVMREIDEGFEQHTLSLGDAIKRIRKGLYGMTQKQYAKFVGISEKTLRDVEKGNTDPRLSVMEKLLKPGGIRLSGRRLK